MNNVVNVKVFRIVDEPVSVCLCVCIQKQFVSIVTRCVIDEFRFFLFSRCDGQLLQRNLFTSDQHVMEFRMGRLGGGPEMILSSCAELLSHTNSIKRSQRRNRRTTA